MSEMAMLRQQSSLGEGHDLLVSVFRFAKCHNYNVMASLIKALKGLGIIGGVLVLFLSLNLFAGRHSLFLWAILAALVLPVVFWLRLGFKKWCAGCLLIALGLAVSPIDITVMRLERPGLRVLPISYGLGCQSGTACYGCVIPANPPRKALVISY